MIPPKIKDLPNPYFPMTPQLSTNEFVGREDEITQLQSTLEEYRKTFRTKNLTITGEKSIGKSTLLHRFLQILQDNNFIVYETELARDPSIEIDEFEFFKEIIDELFQKYAMPDGAFLDVEQSEIWFSLTSGDYTHKSTFNERKLAFATQYSNRKKGNSEKLSYKQLQHDFEIILDSLISIEMDCQGFVILIDEFQELSRNTVILETLRILSEKLTSLIIIGAGLPTYLDNPIFEKFSRTSEIINLTSLKYNEIIELICRPLEQNKLYSRHEVMGWFHGPSINEIIHRSIGNPQHIKILCCKMFEYYKNSTSSNFIALNKTVMEEVMNFYSSISEKSRRIRLSLQSCIREQLISFALLYKYEGFSIRTAIQLELAFKPLIVENENIVKDKFINAFKDIWDLNLFEFKNETVTLETFLSANINQLANIEYKFIGDSIDKLYASYYYEELTGDKLIQTEDTFEDALARKLAADLTNVLVEASVPKEIFIPEPLTNCITSFEEDSLNTNDIVTDLNKMIQASENIKTGEIDESIYKVSEKHQLIFPAHLSHIFELTGYYIILLDIHIRGKKKILFCLFPVKCDLDKVVEIREYVKDISIDKTILEQYMIKIDSIYIYWLPQKPLTYIFNYDLKIDIEDLYKKVEARLFDDAVEIADGIKELTTKIKPKYVEASVSALNNYGFCLININSIPEAKKTLKLIENQLLSAKANLAYIAYIENDFEGARQILNKIVRKGLGKDSGWRFLHLAINHPKLSTKNRIVENISLHQVACWNLALLNCQEEKDQSLIYSYLKKINPRGNDQLIDQRVRSWICYYSNKIPEALNYSRKLLKGCTAGEYIYRDVEKDISIFESDLN